MEDEIERSFMENDTNKDGHLKLQNILQALRDLGYNPTEDQLKDWLVEYGNRVNFVGYLQIMGSLMGKKGKKFLEWKYKDIMPEDHNTKKTYKDIAKEKLDQHKEDVDGTDGKPEENNKEGTNQGQDATKSNGVLKNRPSRTFKPHHRCDDVKPEGGGNCLRPDEILMAQKLARKRMSMCRRFMNF